MSEIYVGKTIIKNATTGETKAYELSKDSYDYLEYEANRAIVLERRVEELENMLEASTYIQRMLRKESRLYKKSLKEIIVYEPTYEDELIGKLKNLSSYLQEKMTKYGDRYGEHYSFERYDELQSVMDAINQILEGDD